MERRVFENVAASASLSPCALSVHEMRRGFDSPAVLQDLCSSTGAHICRIQGRARTQGCARGLASVHSSMSTSICFIRLLIC